MGRLRGRVPPSRPPTRNWKTTAPKWGSIWPPVSGLSNPPDHPQALPAAATPPGDSSTRTAAAPKVSPTLRVRAITEAPAKQAGARGSSQLPSRAGDAWRASPGTMRPGLGPRPAGMTVRFGRVGIRARTSRSAFPRPPVAARFAALPAGPSRLTPGRNGPGPPQRPSPPRTLSARPVAPPPSSPGALLKPLRPTLQQTQPHCCVPASVLLRPAAGCLPVGSAPRGASRKVLRVGNPTAFRPLVAAMRIAP